jgi:hypothetical protein
MKNLKFKKGDFITQIGSTQGSFAVFDGDEFEMEGRKMYALMCYYNCEHYTQNSEGHFVKEHIFECDVEDNTCEYAVEETDMDSWRLCTTDEQTAALKYLAEEKKIAYVPTTKRFRKLLPHEVINFGTPRSTGTCGGNAYRNGNPYYGKGGMPLNRPTTTTKTITRVVKEDWEQKEPVCTISEEHTILLQAECERLKYSFNSYTVASRPFVGGCYVGQGLDQYDEYGMQNMYGAYDEYYE